jgi:predicted aspartyl protease
VSCLFNDVYRAELLVDTGAAFTMLSRRVAAEMKIDLSRPLRHERIASVHQTARIPIVRLDSLQISSQRAIQIEVLVFSFPTDLRIDGLLGVNFLEKFRTTIEFDRSILVLR